MNTAKIDEVIMLYLTSSDCGACASLRGNGIIGNGNQYMGFEKLSSLLNDGITFLNVHFRIRDGKISSIIDISKLWYQKPTEEERKKGINERIIQEKCFKFENKVKVMLLEMELVNPIREEQKLPYEVKKTRAIETYMVVKNDSDEPVLWDDWVKKQIPDKIENFAGGYAPQVIVVRKKDWKKSLENGSPFHAMTDRGKIAKQGNDWGLIRDFKMINQYGMDIGQIIQELRKGTFKFEAIEQSSPQSEEVPKTVPKTINKGRYIYYDDPE